MAYVTNTSSQDAIVFEFHLTSTLGTKVSWDPFHPGWIASAVNNLKDVAQAMKTNQHLVNV